ncbi:helix-turn-helix domain containing protein [Mycobacterium sp. CPCC 205372]|uniref:Helix-turn-helix domain containing protein n=1 Tax=Mycobacterium hippophais TaxID=3016340 RepID=A0ABT4PUG3_9MYCO|nr:TetR/AcrR family transcriptional regulator [Mycobacterium hippophais]MCZ8380222.1 helix-turn-helix domain containing protein [Mycobacterium hippophais]
MFRECNAKVRNGIPQYADDMPETGSTGWQPQRDLAARNEANVLDAARALLRGPDAGDVDMRVIAQRAGVGVGTLYRRFGDKAGLLAALVGGDERTLQEAILSGPPPLGPGAPAGDRITAFLDALVSLTERNLGALLVTDAIPPGRLKLGAYQGWRLHIVTLLRAARTDLDAANAGWHADMLLAAVDPQLYAYQRRDLKMSKRRIATNAKGLAAAVMRT